MKTFSKQPREVIDYEVSFRNYFKKFVGDEINTVTVTIRDVEGGTPALVAGPDALPEYELPGSNPQYCKVWIGGGESQRTYIVSVLITTTAGRAKELDFKVRVLDQ